MNAPLSTATVIALLDNRSEAIVGGNQIELHKTYGLDALVPHYVAAFPRIRNYPGRMHILFWLVRFARQRADVVELAVSALSDPSRIVRHHACAALAYSGDRSALSPLRKLAFHRSEATRGDARAAIAAIQEGNHHLFVDRNRTGRHLWIVNAEDER